MSSWHDWHIVGWSVDGLGRSLRLVVAEDHPCRTTAPFRTLRFEGVHAHALEMDMGVNVISEIHEMPIRDGVALHWEVFCAYAKWGWPTFLQDDIESTARGLEAQGARWWRVSASYGLNGWIVAQSMVEDLAVRGRSATTRAEW